MEGCVDGAFFCQLPSGWNSRELFYGWLANHFAKCVTEWLLVLLVNSNSSHIDVEVSKFCRDQQINLYCIPTHTSRIIQHLDVGFFGALKTTWERHVKNTRLLTLVSLHGIPPPSTLLAGFSRMPW